MTSRSFIRDSAGKKAFVRTAVEEGSEQVDTDQGYAWYVVPRTGRYYVVAI